MSEPTEPVLEPAIERVRAFNRHWTEVLGLLDQGLLATDLSLTEARVMYELNQRDRWEQVELRRRLGIDPSFLTRTVNQLVGKGLVASTPSATDGRAIELRLTAAGSTVADDLSARSSAQVAGLLAPLTAEQRATAVEAMSVLANLIRPDGRPPERREVTLRDYRPGDLGWVASRNGAVYADQFGWGDGYEALCAQIMAEFDRDFRPGRERGWIAEVDGARAGHALVRERTPDEAQIRLVLVERWARGLGIGTRLVDECLAFSRDAGYTSIMLWTNDVLVSARRIYEAAGFELVDEEAHHSFGHDLVGQTWRRPLP